MNGDYIDANDTAAALAMAVSEGLKVARLVEEYRARLTAEAVARLVARFCPKATNGAGAAEYERARAILARWSLEADE